MGSLFSKCFKSRSKNSYVIKTIKDDIKKDKENNIQIKLGEDKPPQINHDKKNIEINKNNPKNNFNEKKPLKQKFEESKITTANDKKMNNEELEKNASFNFEKTNSLQKNKKNPNDYFSHEELQYYAKLYETEIYDIQESKKIQRFQKGELIGEGSFGKVYQGFDTESGQIIAIKEIDLKMVNNKYLEKIKSFEQEIDILSKLHNKNIIKYFGTSRNKENLNIFLEYCIGGSIAKMLEVYGKFNENIIRKYTKQILEGLEYLHVHNVIHRDIKGANILVDKSGVCKLSDFGGAKKIAEEFEANKKHSFKGTPHWMAPETIKNLETTRFSDIWSFGCTVIEMATGEPPWSEFKNPLTAIYNIMNATSPPPIPEFLSTNLKNFLQNCLKMNPTERMNVRELLRHPFITGDSLDNSDYKTGSRMKFGSVISNKNYETLKNKETLLKKSSSSQNIPKSPPLKDNDIYISGLSKKNSIEQAEKYENNKELVGRRKS